MTIEQRMDQLEKRNKRLRVALTMTVVAVAAVVTMAATGEKRGEFDIVKARRVWVTNDAGHIVVGLDATNDGNGLVMILSAKGKDLVNLTSTEHNNGDMINVFNKTGEDIVQMYADEYGNGVVGAWNRKGKGRTLQPGP